MVEEHQIEPEDFALDVYRFVRRQWPDALVILAYQSDITAYEVTFSQVQDGCPCHAVVYPQYVDCWSYDDRGRFDRVGEIDRPFDLDLLVPIFQPYLE